MTKEKIPCTLCSAMILPSTAEKTNGLCKPCYKKPTQKTQRGIIYPRIGAGFEEGTAVTSAKQDIIEKLQKCGWLDEISVEKAEILKKRVLGYEDHKLALATLCAVGIADVAIEFPYVNDTEILIALSNISDGLFTPANIKTKIKYRKNKWEIIVNISFEFNQSAFKAKMGNYADELLALVEEALISANIKQRFISLPYEYSVLTFVSAPTMYFTFIAPETFEKAKTLGVFDNLIAEREKQKPKAIPLDLDKGLIPLLLNSDFDEDEAAAFAEKIRASRLPFLELEAAKYEDIKPWQSKCFGAPYLPKEREYPLDKHGRPLALLVQINFAEAPALSGYPDSGLLQLFFHDELKGLPSKKYYKNNKFKELTKQKNFRVVFYNAVTENMDELTMDFSFLPEFRQDDEECRLSFSLMEHAVSTYDYLFERILGVDPYEKDGRWQTYKEKTYLGGDKIGGYACFPHEDPRASTPAGENWLLLFQAGGPIGDVLSGVGYGHFFIRDTDLQNRDFSHVAFSWEYD